MTKATPAPWSVSVTQTDIDGEIVDVYILDNQLDAQDDEACANANLMETAPDMLKMLQKFHDWFECHSNEEVEMFDELELIIKKALEGEE